MLCEEQGFFLEIADIIRGFGLSILKGVMEVRGNKIWAHFIVEVSFLSYEIFLSVDISCLPKRSLILSSPVLISILLWQASSHVTRIDVFWSLVRLLQQTSTDGIDSTNQPSNVVMDGGIPLLDSYQKFPPPICLTETLH